MVLIAYSKQRIVVLDILFSMLGRKGKSATDDITGQG